jgi:hypothetical protein
MRLWPYVTSLAILGISATLFFSCGDKDDDEADDCEKAGGGAGLVAADCAGGGSGGRPGGGGGGSGGNATGDKGSSGSTGSTCALTANTEATDKLSTYGCALRTRDTSSCKASREAQGLSGFWLKFSCAVTLEKSGDSVTLTTTNLPDHPSYYFSSSDACYEAFTSDVRAANPNLIASQTITMTVPYAPAAADSAEATPGGVIGLALNGISLYDNEAAPGDDIYKEERTFDKCDGHPDMSSRYHYHTEPSSITNADDNFIGVMRDGFPIYGRVDSETGAEATGLDESGGKTGKTVDSPETAVYHYHVNLQSNGTDSAYFLSAGSYKGTPGECTGCQ